MKATHAQYVTAYDIYCKEGPSAVLAYGQQLGLDFSSCKDCETSTPDCQDGTCLVCGSKKIE